MPAYFKSLCRTFTTSAEYQDSPRDWGPPTFSPEESRQIREGIGKKVTVPKIEAES
jgi:hypothetical protein